MISVNTDSRWIGLHGPHSRISWMKNELTTTVSISAAQIQPNRRCGIVPFGAASWTAPSAKAPSAAKACHWMTAGAASSGARVIECQFGLGACDERAHRTGLELDLVEAALDQIADADDADKGPVADDREMRDTP